MESKPLTNDAELLAEFVKGNPDAMNALVEAHGRMLYGYILAMTRNRPEADDIFQETWFRVMKKAHRFRAGNFKGWMMRIAHNLIVDQVRRNRPNISLEAPDAKGGTLYDSMSDPRPGPSSHAETTDLAGLARKQVDDLPAEQKEVFLLRTDGDLSFRQIAETLGIPLNTALGRMRYAILHLRRELAPIMKNESALNEQEAS